MAGDLGRKVAKMDARATAAIDRTERRVFEAARGLARNWAFIAVVLGAGLLALGVTNNQFKHARNSDEWKRHRNEVRFEIAVGTMLCVAGLASRMRVK